MTDLEGDAVRAASGDDERAAWIVVATVDGVGPATFGRLVERHGSARAVLRLASSPAGRRLLGRTVVETGPAVGLAERLAEAGRLEAPVLDRLAATGLVAITPLDEAYPRRLRRIDQPPPVLFVQGDLTVVDPDRAVAVVGTRRPTERGRRTAARIAAALVRMGAVVVSGLAIGIDGAAHAATLATAGRTIAVLGGGHRRLFPKAHGRLAAEIVGSGGAVISEFAPEVHPVPASFPRRNRLVSGLADATVVVEAAVGSGALITAGLALEQGRDCFIVPGSIDEPSSGGCLAFLRSYAGAARIVVGLPELIEDLGLGSPSPDPARRPLWAPTATARRRGTTRPIDPDAAIALLPDGERSVAQGLLGGGATADELAARTGLSVPGVLGLLTLLEMRGLVVATFGRYRPAGALAAAAPLAGTAAESFAGTSGTNG